MPLWDKKSIQPVNKKRGKMKKNLQNLKKIILIISLIVLVGLIFVALLSYLNPSSKYGYRTLFIDNTSHYYQKDMPFKYGNYEFTLSPTMKSLGQKENCRLVATNAANNPVLPWKSHPWNPSWLTQQQYWQRHYDNVLTACELENKEKDEKELLDIQMNVKNISRTIKSIKRDYFKIEIDGKVLDNNKNVDFYLKDNIGPNENSNNALNTKVNKNQKEIEVLITLPNRATQIIKID